MLSTQGRPRTRGLERIRNLRGWQAGVMLSGVAVTGLALGGVALGAAGGSPSMQVLPSATGVKYSQTVEVKAQNLPKGSGSTAVTICGLSNAAGEKIPTPTADDCAGADDLSSGLVKLAQWKDGNFDQQYTLPKSGQKFGKNQHACDAKHFCALVVADANPSKPAYFISTDLLFTDQKPAGQTPTTTKTKKPTKKPTPTTKPKAVAPTTTSSTTTTTTAPRLAVNGGGSANAGGQGSGKVSFSFTLPNPDGTQPSLPALPTGPSANPIPPQAAAALNQACAQLAQAAQQGGADTTALTTACSTLVNGGGGAQLGMILQSPSLGCFAASSLTQNNAQLADACSQLATALQPYSSQLGTGLAPVLGLLP
jgi:hypothetical protein